MLSQNGWWHVDSGWSTIVLLSRYCKGEGRAQEDYWTSDGNQRRETPFLHRSQPDCMDEYGSYACLVQAGGQATPHSYWECSSFNMSISTTFSAKRRTTFSDGHQFDWTINAFRIISINLTISNKHISHDNTIHTNLMYVQSECIDCIIRGHLKHHHLNALSDWLRLRIKEEVIKLSSWLW